MDCIDKSRKNLENTKIFHRDYYYDILDKYGKTNNITIVQGQRRVGKSFVIIGYLQKLGVAVNKIFYLNKENDVSDKIHNVDILESCFQDFVKQNGEPKFIVIDEIQDIQDRERFIRDKATNQKYKIIITGSNSQLLSGDLATYLTGRILSLFVYPLDYREYLDFKKIKSDTNESFMQYILDGGMPEAILSNDDMVAKNYLQMSLEAMIYKDIVKRYKIKEIVLLEKTLEYLANIQGKLVSINNITSYIESTKNFPKLSANTISSYLTYLQNAFIIQKVKRYNIFGKKVFEFSDKYYFMDHGLKNLYGYDPRFDIGKILESLVYIKLRKQGYTVYVGDIDGKEVDFVAIKPNEKIYIQVCYIIGDHQPTFDREFGSLKQIKDNYKKIVLSLDPLAGGNIDGIDWVKLDTWL